MKNKKCSFHNYANISHKETQKYSIICLYWESGSGKTSYIKEILKQHDWVSIWYKRWKKIKSDNETLIVVDEILYFSNFFSIIPLCFSRKKLLIATHVPLIYYKIFSLVWRKVLCINLEKYPLKIKKYLKDRGYSFSDESIELYQKKFLCTYTDLDIILESDSHIDKNFDRIIKQFIKLHKIDVFPSN